MKRTWWKEGVVYQIYPRSFKDSNGDGVGDLRGIIEKLDYLKELGVDIVWLSPVYKSPNDDNGYDISDYFGIMDEFGSMEDLELLIRGLHARGMRIIMDLVVNHTSDEHPWFQQSRSSKANPYRDYYIWRPGRGDAAPNNWSVWFSDSLSAWEQDPTTGEYYLHLFSKKQPDLNWENPQLRQEIYRMMRWWLQKGIDGFRMDVINMIAKDLSLPDGEVKPGGRYGSGRLYYLNQPRVHEYLREMNDRVLSEFDIMTVGETPGVTPEIAAMYVNEDRHELNMVFQFELMSLDRDPQDRWKRRQWRLTELKAVFDRWIHGLAGKGWNSLYMSNHDQPRQVSRFGDDGRYRVESAKLLATLLHTLPGTPFIYQGEEIGMTNAAFGSIDDYRDIWTHEMYRNRRLSGQSEEEIMAAIRWFSRDNSRTPMQWDAGPNAGFTTGTPWLKVNPNYKTINVAAEVDNRDSVLSYYRELIRLRKENLTLVYGTYEQLAPQDEQIYAYLRASEHERLLVILNFSADPATFQLPATASHDQRRLLIANYPVEDDGAPGDLTLRPFEARVYRLC